jgi:hypothetical protein
MASSRDGLEQGEASGKMKRDWAKESQFDRTMFHSEESTDNPWQWRGILSETFSRLPVLC